MLEPSEAKPFASPAASLKATQNQILKGKECLLGMRETLIQVMGSPKDFVRQQWFQLSAFALAFEPELIIELGRGYGNSTCVLTWVSNTLPKNSCRVESFCIADCWRTSSFEALKSTKGEDFFSQLTAHEQNILSVDFEKVVGEAQRVFVFWDAHGWDVANYVVANLFPLLAKRESVIAVHDMADLRFHADGLKYNDPDYWFGFNTAPPKIILNNIGMQYEEGVVLLDFATRNHLQFNSAESSYFSELTESDYSTLQAMLGPENVSRYGYWYYMKVGPAATEMTFPESIPPLISECENTSDASNPVEAPPPSIPPSFQTRVRRKLKHWYSRAKQLI